MSAYQSVKVSSIDIPEGRLRDVDQEWAECLAGMFSETGQLTPIDVVTDGKRFSLVAGAHRLTAAKINKWKEIDARILEPKAEQAADELRLHEILENLGRKNFNALERCEALYEMKRIHEQLHPETKHGGKRGNQHTGGEKRQVAIFAFCQNAKETTGLSRRSVELAVQIFEGLSPETRERLKGTEYAQKQSNLKALSEMDVDAQKGVMDLLIAPAPDGNSDPDADAENAPKQQVSSIADAKAIASGAKPKSETEQLFERVSNILPKLPTSSQHAVFRQHKKAIVALAKRERWLHD